MSDYTPEKTVVEYYYMEGAERICGTTAFRASDEFDRFIAKIKAETLREALADLGDQGEEATVVAGDENDEASWVDLTLREWLTFRADRIEADA